MIPAQRWWSADNDHWQLAITTRQWLVGSDWQWGYRLGGNETGWQLPSGYAWLSADPLTMTFCLWSARTPGKRTTSYRQQETSHQLLSIVYDSWLGLPATSGYQQWSTKIYCRLWLAASNRTYLAMPLRLLLAVIDLLWLLAIGNDNWHWLAAKTRGSMTRGDSMTRASRLSRGSSKDCEYGAWLCTWVVRSLA